MTAAEVTQALVGFEARLRDLGVPVVDRLRPGLSRQQVDQISGEFGVRLSQDAAAYWMWHDGDRERYEDDRLVPSLTPFSVFSGLRGALERSALMQRHTWTDAFEDPQPWGPEWDVHFRAQYVILLDNGGIPLTMDCTEPGADDSPTGIYAPGEGLGATISLTERISWWHWALDNGYWLVTSDKKWDIDLTRAPGQLVGLHVRDNAS